MVTKLTAWKTIAVKDATYAVATKKKPEKKNYLLKVTKVRPRRETFKCDIFRWNKTYTTFIMADRSGGVVTNHIRARQVRPRYLYPKAVVWKNMQMSSKFIWLVELF